MKVKEDYVLQELIDEAIVVPVGAAADQLRGVIKLNPTGCFLWKLLETKDYSEAELIDCLTNEYDVAFNVAMSDVEIFINQLKEMNCLLE